MSKEFVFAILLVNVYTTTSAEKCPQFVGSNIKDDEQLIKYLQPNVTCNNSYAIISISNCRLDQLEAAQIFISNRATLDSSGLTEECFSKIKGESAMFRLRHNECGSNGEVEFYFETQAGILYSYNIVVVSNRSLDQNEVKVNVMKAQCLVHPHGSRKSVASNEQDQDFVQLRALNSEVRVSDYIYVQLQSDGADLNNPLEFRSCWSTPSSSPADDYRYELIKDGKSLTNVHNTTLPVATLLPNGQAGIAQFKFKSFLWGNSVPTVYVHCSTYVSRTQATLNDEGDTLKKYKNKGGTRKRRDSQRYPPPSATRNENTERMGISYVKSENIIVRDIEKKSDSSDINTPSLVLRKDRIKHINPLHTPPIGTHHDKQANRSLPQEFLSHLQPYLPRPLSLKNFKGKELESIYTLPKPPVYNQKSTILNAAVRSDAYTALNRHNQGRNLYWDNLLRVIPPKPPPVYQARNKSKNNFITIVNPHKLLYGFHLKLIEDTLHKPPNHFPQPPIDQLGKALNHPKIPILGAPKIDHKHYFDSRWRSLPLQKKNRPLLPPPPSLRKLFADFRNLPDYLNANTPHKNYKYFNQKHSKLSYVWKQLPGTQALPRPIQLPSLHSQSTNSSRPFHNNLRMLSHFHHLALPNIPTHPFLNLLQNVHPIPGPPPPAKVNRHNVTLNLHLPNVKALPSPPPPLDKKYLLYINDSFFYGYELPPRTKDYFRDLNVPIVRQSVRKHKTLVREAKSTSISTKRDRSLHDFKPKGNFTLKHLTKESLENQVKESSERDQSNNKSLKSNLTLVSGRKRKKKRKPKTKTHSLQLIYKSIPVKRLEFRHITSKPLQAPPLIYTNRGDHNRSSPRVIPPHLLSYIESKSLCRRFFIDGIHPHPIPSPLVHKKNVILYNNSLYQASLIPPHLQNYYKSSYSNIHTPGTSLQSNLESHGQPLIRLSRSKTAKPTSTNPNPIPVPPHLKHKENSSRIYVNGSRFNKIPVPPHLRNYLNCMRKAFHLNLETRKRSQKYYHGVGMTGILKFKEKSSTKAYVESTHLTTVQGRKPPFMGKTKEYWQSKDNYRNSSDKEDMSVVGKTSSHSLQLRNSSVIGSKKHLLKSYVGVKERLHPRLSLASHLRHKVSLHPPRHKKHLNQLEFKSLKRNILETRHAFPKPPAHDQSITVFLSQGDAYRAIKIPAQGRNLYWENLFRAISLPRVYQVENKSQNNLVNILNPSKPFYGLHLKLIEDTLHKPPNHFPPTPIHQLGNALNHPKVPILGVNKIYNKHYVDASWRSLPLQKIPRPLLPPPPRLRFADVRNLSDYMNANTPHTKIKYFNQKHSKLSYVWKQLPGTQALPRPIQLPSLHSQSTNSSRPFHNNLGISSHFHHLALPNIPTHPFLNLLQNAHPIPGPPLATAKVNRHNITLNLHLPNVKALPLPPPPPLDKKYLIYINDSFFYGYELPPHIKDYFRGLNVSIVRQSVRKHKTLVREAKSTSISTKRDRSLHAFKPKGNFTLKHLTKESLENRVKVLNERDQSNNKSLKTNLTLVSGRKRIKKRKPKTKTHSLQLIYKSIPVKRLEFRHITSKALQAPPLIHTNRGDHNRSSPRVIPPHLLSYIESKSLCKRFLIDGIHPRPITSPLVHKNTVILYNSSLYQASLIPPHLQNYYKSSYSNIHTPYSSLQKNLKSYDQPLIRLSRSKMAKHTSTNPTPIAVPPPHLKHKENSSRVYVNGSRFNKIPVPPHFRNYLNCIRKCFHLNLEKRKRSQKYHHGVGKTGISKFKDKSSTKAYVESTNLTTVQGRKPPFMGKTKEYWQSKDNYRNSSDKEDTSVVGKTSSHSLQLRNSPAIGSKKRLPKSYVGVKERLHPRLGLASHLRHKESLHPLRHKKLPHPLPPPLIKQYFKDVINGSMNFALKNLAVLPSHYRMRQILAGNGHISLLAKQSPPFRLFPYDKSEEKTKKGNISLFQSLRRSRNLGNKTFFVRLEIPHPPPMPPLEQSKAIFLNNTLYKAHPLPPDLRNSYAAMRKAKLLKLNPPFSKRKLTHRAFKMQPKSKRIRRLKKLKSNGNQSTWISSTKQAVLQSQLTSNQSFVDGFKVRMQSKGTTQPKPTLSTKQKKFATRQSKVPNQISMKLKPFPVQFHQIPREKHFFLRMPPHVHHQFFQKHGLLLNSSLLYKISPLVSPSIRNQLNNKSKVWPQGFAPLMSSPQYFQVKGALGIHKLIKPPPLPLPVRHKIFHVNNASYYAYPLPPRLRKHYDHFKWALQNAIKRLTYRSFREGKLWNTKRRKDVHEKTSPTPKEAITQNILDQHGIQGKEMYKHKLQSYVRNTTTEKIRKATPAISKIDSSSGKKKPKAERKKPKSLHGPLHHFEKKSTEIPYLMRKIMMRNGTLYRAVPFPAHLRRLYNQNDTNLFKAVPMQPPSIQRVIGNRSGLHENHLAFHYSLKPLLKQNNLTAIHRQRWPPPPPLVKPKVVQINGSTFFARPIPPHLQHYLDFQRRNLVKPLHLLKHVILRNKSRPELLRKPKVHPKKHKRVLRQRLQTTGASSLKSQSASIIRATLSQKVQPNVSAAGEGKHFLILNQTDKYLPTVQQQLTLLALTTKQTVVSRKVLPKKPQLIHHGPLHHKQIKQIPYLPHLVKPKLPVPPPPLDQSRRLIINNTEYHIRPVPPHLKHPYERKKPGFQKMLAHNFMYNDRLKLADAHLNHKKGIIRGLRFPPDHIKKQKRLSNHKHNRQDLKHNLMNKKASKSRIQPEEFYSNITKEDSKVEKRTIVKVERHGAFAEDHYNSLLANINLTNAKASVDVTKVLNSTKVKRLINLLKKVKALLKHQKKKPKPYSHPPVLPSDHDRHKQSKRFKTIPQHYLHYKSNPKFQDLKKRFLQEVKSIPSPTQAHLIISQQLVNDQHSFMSEPNTSQTNKFYKASQFNREHPIPPPKPPPFYTPLQTLWNLGAASSPVPGLNLSQVQKQFFPGYQPIFQNPLPQMPYPPNYSLNRFPQPLSTMGLLAPPSFSYFVSGLPGMSMWSIMPMMPMIYNVSSQHIYSRNFSNIEMYGNNPYPLDARTSIRNRPREETFPAIPQPPLEGSQRRLFKRNVEVVKNAPQEQATAEALHAEEKTKSISQPLSAGSEDVERIISTGPIYVSSLSSEDCSKVNQGFDEICNYVTRKKNGGCHHICIQGLYGRTCSCRRGYEMHANRAYCVESEGTLSNTGLSYLEKLLKINTHFVAMSALLIGTCLLLLGLVVQSVSTKASRNYLKK